MIRLVAEVLVAGRAEGRVLRLDEPLSLWGGLDPATGLVIDARHPQRGRSVTGRILVLPRGRGSSSASSVLLEAVRVGTAPAALVLRETDPILALGAIVAGEMYGRRLPVVAVGEGFDALTEGAWAALSEAGEIAVGKAGEDEEE